MDQAEFKDFIFRKLIEQKGILPFEQIEMGENDFCLYLTIDGKKESLNLHNLYKECQNGHLDEMFLNLLSVLQSRHKGEGHLKFSKERVIPIIRNHFESDYFSIPLEQNLTLGLAIEFEDSIHYVERSRLDNEEEWLDLAVLNARKKGWLNESNKEVNRIGQILLYKNKSEEFLFQFFIHDWTNEKLGSQFYLIIPNKNTAVVFIPNGNEDSILEGILKLKEWAVKMNIQEAYGISEKVYHSHGKEFKMIG